MKNEKINLLDLKIKIHAQDTLAFQETALLVDKPEFLEMLPQLRKDLEVENTVDLKDYIDVAYEKPSHNNRKKKKINFSKYKGIENTFDAVFLHKTFTHKEDIFDEMDMYSLIANEVNIVCVKFNRPPYFAEVVKQAISAVRR
jgi:hypothetical protein